MHNTDTWIYVFSITCTLMRPVFKAHIRELQGQCARVYVCVCVISLKLCYEIKPEWSVRFFNLFTYNTDMDGSSFSNKILWGYFIVRLGKVCKNFLHENFVKDRDTLIEQSILQIMHFTQKYNFKSQVCASHRLVHVRLLEITFVHTSVCACVSFNYH